MFFFFFLSVMPPCDTSVYFGSAEKLLGGFSRTKSGLLIVTKLAKQTLCFPVVFGGADGVQSSNIDKKQAATRHSAPCGKLKCQTRKNLCIAYTQVNTHAHFFLSLSLSVFPFFFFLNESLSHRRHTSPERSRAPRHDDG